LQHEYVIDVALDTAPGDPDTGSRVGLRIDIDQKHPLVKPSERRSEVNRGSGFPDTTLLIRNSYSLRHSSEPASVVTLKRQISILRARRPNLYE
jgi:hypothetical protein